MQQSELVGAEKSRTNQFIFHRTFQLAAVRLLHDRELTVTQRSVAAVTMGEFSTIARLALSARLHTLA